MSELPLQTFNIDFMWVIAYLMLNLQSLKRVYCSHFVQRPRTGQGPAALRGHRRPEETVGFVNFLKKLLKDIRNIHQKQGTQTVLGLHDAIFVSLFPFDLMSNFNSGWGNKSQEKPRNRVVLF